MTIEYSSHFAPLPASLVGEVAALSEKIFSPPAIDYGWRLNNMPNVSLFCARNEGLLVGFKAGYAIAERKYYSWLGAVHAEFRKQSIASHLAQLQHAWLAQCNCSTIETSSSESNNIMAHINSRSGFSVVGTKLEPHGLQVLWSKRLA